MKTRMPSLVALLVVSLGLTACGSGRLPGPGPALTPVPATDAPPPTPGLDETSIKPYEITDFDAAHAPVGGAANEYLILGKVPVAQPAPDLPPELAVFLGRWEGYSYAPPVKKDRKVVLVVQGLTVQGGHAVTWSGTNLQYPDLVAQVQFRVIAGAAPALEFRFVWPRVRPEINTLTYDRETGLLHVVSDNPASGPYVLGRDRAFHVYKDYAAYLAGKRISARAYQNSQLQHYGPGYLLYLPEDYEADPQKSWPLLFFLHGSGDRGDNVLLLAKASPFMYIREQGPLPFIIVAPLLNDFAGYASFPGDYLAGVLAEIQAVYRADAQRIYVTGLSMGGEATYRLAAVEPGTFAAIAPLSAYVDSDTYSMLGRIKDLPVWAIHGADDTVVPLARAQQPVDALRGAGGTVRFTVLPGHDHDVWTDTYSDRGFYDWLLQHRRP